MRKAALIGVLVVAACTSTPTPMPGATVAVPTSPAATVAPSITPIAAEIGFPGQRERAGAGPVTDLDHS